MEKFVPYDKLSKKKRTQLNKRKRKTWGEIKPVTRSSQNPKAYNRRKVQKQDDDFLLLNLLYGEFRLTKLLTFNIMENI